MWWLVACTDPQREKPQTSETAATVDSEDSTHGDSASADPPIVVVILADDLGDNFLWALDTVSTRLEPESVRFTRAYATDPLCCPVRASFLSGGFTARSTGVYDNELPNGGVTRMTETRTLGTELMRAGVATALIGKYLNAYELDPSWIPAGWTELTVPTLLGDFTDTQLVTGSSTADDPGLPTAIDTGGEHLTGWIFDRGLAFLDAHPDEPIFLLLTPQSPHILGTPAAEDLGTWAGYEWRPPSFDEADMSDKPAWVRSHPGGTAATWDAENQWMLENGESLDRGVGAFLDGLVERGLDTRTTVLFVGDNGHLHGEHRLVAKGVAYEESIAVPLLVRAPGVPARQDTRLVAWNLDLPATVLDLFGEPSWGEGESLLPALADATAPGRDHVFLEGASKDIPVWSGVVTERWKYVEWAGGDLELYDRDTDPYELENLAADPPVDLATMAAWIDAERALAILTPEIAALTPDVATSTTLEAWGGSPPLTWTMAGSVPGLTLSSDGVLSGTPTEEGSTAVTIEVTDSSTSPVTGGPERFGRVYTIVVGAEREAVARREGEVVRFRFPARDGERVRACAGIDPTRDTPPICADARVHAGEAEAEIPLDPHRRWWWWAERDGRAQGGARVPYGYSP